MDGIKRAVISGNVWNQQTLTHAKKKAGLDVIQTPTAHAVRVLTNNQASAGVTRRWNRNLSSGGWQVIYTRKAC